MTGVLRNWFQRPVITKTLGAYILISLLTYSQAIQYLIFACCCSFSFHKPKTNNETNKTKQAKNKTKQTINNLSI